MRSGTIVVGCAAALGALLAASSGCGRDPSVADAAQSDGAPLVLVTSPDMPPYSYCDETSGEIVGIEIEIARAAAAKLGRRLEIRTAKFPDLLPMVDDGKADMAASGITITEGRLQTVDFSIPYATEGGVFLYRASDPMPTMIRAETLRIATMDASTYDFYLCSHNIESVRYDNFSQVLADLKAGRVDAVFCDSCVAKQVAEKSGGELAVSRFETRENFGIAVRKGDATLKAVLDEAIAERRRK